MSNNQNDLDDLMQVLQNNTGGLTDEDKRIHSDDERTIRDIAWPNYNIPIVRTESPGSIIFNNQVSPQYMDLWKGTDIKMQQPNYSNEDVTEYPKPEMHYYENDIGTIEAMGNMSLNNHPIRDESDSSYSWSPETLDSSSDYQPGPSSIEHQSHYGSYTSDIPSGEPRRLSKVEKKTMTAEQLETRKREANKKNSKNYNKTKKEKEHFLREQVVGKKRMKKDFKKNNKLVDNQILECYALIKEYIEIPKSNAYFIDEQCYRTHKDELERQARNRKHYDQNRENLEKKFGEAEKVYYAAAGDLKTKRENTNTYGSRKSRALHTMNIAKYALAIAELDLEIKKFECQENWMETIRTRMIPILKVANISPENWLKMPEEKRSRFEELSTFINHPACTKFLETRRRLT